MIPFGVVVLALGLADLIAGFSGRPKGFIRCALGWVAGVGSAVGIGAFIGYDVQALLILAALVSVLLPFWFLIRATEHLSVGRGAFGFWTIVLVLAGLIGTGSLWPSPEDEDIRDWLQDVPIQGVAESLPRIVLCTALIVFLLATANGIVRLVLAMSSEDSETGRAPTDQEARLRGGRMIGPIERLLIFGFVVAGQITAAVVVVSAKALLRFPEVSRESKNGGPHEIHRLNEYLVVGSLSSWALAFLAAALLRASAGG